ncbi:hydroxyisourate hydrolase [Priestia megaterium]|uniref:hydroxyisourate hydrolase n=1 Tax=Priestia megaterium TaxID=1404 RepID=UPI001FD3326E|nr:hydroxyisourate hydrolase [Priestia megaterium]
MKKYVASIAGVAVLSCAGFLGLGQGGQVLQKLGDGNTVAHAASNQSDSKEMEKTQAPAKPKGGLSTHVLDETKGKPAPNVKVKVYRVNEDGEMTYLHTAKTDNEGRVGLLLSPKEMTKGTYEIHFFVGDYFEKQGTKASDEFLDEIPLRFKVTNPKQHYHVPIVAAPGGYSTYHGS